MSQYQVFARKWRPRRFAELVGQEYVQKTLQHALSSQRLHHAYLFTGTRGVGKTTIARILAKSLNCLQGVSAEPCGVCTACQQIDQGVFLDLIEVDAASRTKVEQTRELLDNVQYAPTAGRYKIYLIDEVHMLSTHSFNALLKTLEEPPEHVKFLLATTDPQKLPPTILSRCLRFHLKPIAPQSIADYFAGLLQQENIEFEADALSLLAHSARGSLRDGLSLLEQAVAYGGGAVDKTSVDAMLGSVDQNLIIELVGLLAEQRSAEVLEQAAQLQVLGVDPHNALEALIALFHRLAVIAQVPQAALEHETELKALATQFSPEQIQLYYQIALTGYQDLSQAPDAYVAFEMLILRMLAFCELKAASMPVQGQQPMSAIQTSDRTPAAQARPTQVAASAPNNAADVSPTAKPMPAQSSAESSRWQTLLAKLNLSGVVKQLASHCLLQSFDQQKLLLHLDPQHASLKTERLEEALISALKAELGAELAVEIRITGLSEETPAARQQRIKQENTDQLVHSFCQDPKTQALQQALGAKIDQNSIKLVESD